MTGDDEERSDVTGNSVNINGGTFSGSSAFSAGDHNTVTGSIGAGARPTPDDLGATLRDVRNQLVAAGRTPDERQEIADELGSILKELAKDSPAPAKVRGRWSVVASILGAAAAAGTAIADTTGKITEMITAVFGGA